MTLGSYHSGAEFLTHLSLVGLEITRIVALLHGDLHPLGQLEALHALAHAVVRVAAAPEVVPGGDGAARVAAVLHKKRGGKVVRKVRAGRRWGVGISSCLCS